MFPVPLLFLLPQLLASVPAGWPTAQDVETPVERVEDGTEGRIPLPPARSEQLAELLSHEVRLPGLLSHEGERHLAELLAEAKDHASAWSFAQGLRLRDHAHEGSVWSHDEEALRILTTLTSEAKDPVRRALAADVLADEGALERLVLDPTVAVAVRAFAASRLAPPRGCEELAAGKRLELLWSFFAEEDPYVRVLAARAIGAWIFDLEDQARLFALARTDPSLQVREELFAAVVVLGLPTARHFLRGLENDPGQPHEVRALAHRARARLRIHG